MNTFSRLTGESSLEHALRRQRIKADARDRSEPIITLETERQGWYEDEFVMHVETGTKAQTKRRKSISSLVRMHESGSIDNAQFEAALRIAGVAERIERSVAVRCASLEARVDCSSGNRDVLVEQLNQVRDEATYSRWRRRIPLPRRMILDMILVDRPMATTARTHGVRWEDRNGNKGARSLLLDALDLWCDLRERVSKEIDEQDITRAHARIAA
jgi:hypothetical protein